MAIIIALSSSFKFCFFHRYSFRSNNDVTLSHLFCFFFVIILCKRVIINKLQVSKKVYSDISARIGYSLATSPQSAVEAMRLVNDYLASTLVKSEGSMTLLAFNIKRDEFDCAKTRSRRAHERAVTRKVATGKPRYLSTEEIVERILAGLTLEDFEEISLADPPIPPGRRERQEATRTKKRKWKLLCAPSCRR